MIVSPLAFALVMSAGIAAAQSSPLDTSAAGTLPIGGGPVNIVVTNPVKQERRPWDFGVLAQGGVGVTEDRGGYTFFMAGVHAGKVLSAMHGQAMARGNFEYAMEAFPFWQ